MTRSQTYFFIGIGAMTLVVTTSNILVAHAINDWLTWAAFTYPVAFFVTDMTNRLLGKKPAQNIVLTGFVLGVLLSLIFADARVALASGTAFLTAQLLDITIFNKLRKQDWWRAPLISSTIASALDTMLFFAIAFVGTGVPWITLGIGDYFIKILVALVLLVPFRILYKKLQPTQKPLM